MLWKKRWQSSNLTSVAWSIRVWVANPSICQKLKFCAYLKEKGHLRQDEAKIESVAFVDIARLANMHLTLDKGIEIYENPMLTSTQFGNDVVCSAAVIHAVSIPPGTHVFVKSDDLQAISSAFYANHDGLLFYCMHSRAARKRGLARQYKKAQTTDRFDDEPADYLLYRS